MIKVDTIKTDRISQGDIFKNVELIEYVQEKDGKMEISKILFPLVIVLTQDCDLQQDYTFRTEQRSTKDKLLLSVLVAPLYNSEFVFEGSHLETLQIKMEPINKNKSPGKCLMDNTSPRYHYLEFPRDVQIPPSVIDFKHYFSVNVEYLRSIKSDNFVCKVSELYRELISQRFSNFLSRIGLP